MRYGCPRCGLSIDIIHPNARTAAGHHCPSVIKSDDWVQFRPMRTKGEARQDGDGPEQGQLDLN